MSLKTSPRNHRKPEPGRQPAPPQADAEGQVRRPCLQHRRHVRAAAVHPGRRLPAVLHCDRLHQRPQRRLRRQGLAVPLRCDHRGLRADLRRQPDLERPGQHRHLHRAGHRHQRQHHPVRRLRTVPQGHARPEDPDAPVRHHHVLRRRPHHQVPGGPRPGHAGHRLGRGPAGRGGRVEPDHRQVLLRTHHPERAARSRPDGRGQPTSSSSSRWCSRCPNR